MRLYLTKIYNILIPKQNTFLGRWKLKHNVEYCNEYMLNQYADPGYFNPKKYSKK